MIASFTDCVSGFDLGVWPRPGSDSVVQECFDRRHPGKQLVGLATNFLTRIATMPIGKRAKGNDEGVAERHSLGRTDFLGQREASNDRNLNCSGESSEH